MSKPDNAFDTRSNLDAIPIPDQSLVKVISVDDTPFPPTPPKKFKEVSWSIVQKIAQIVGLFSLKRNLEGTIVFTRKKTKFSSSQRGQGTQESKSQKDLESITDPVTHEPPFQSESAHIHKCDTIHDNA